MRGVAVSLVLSVSGVVSGLASWPGRAVAEEVAPGRQAAELYDEARKILEDDAVKAVELLEASVAAKPTARAYLLLGNAYLRLQRVEEAKRAFERFLELDPRSSRRDRVKKQLQGLDVSYSARLVLTTEPPGATVYLDFKAAGARGKTPLELPVSAGRHRVFFELEGYETVIVKDVVIKEKQREAIHRPLLYLGCDVAVTAMGPANAPVEVRVDGQDPTPLPAQVRVPPGSHTLELSGAGLEPKTVTVQCEDHRPLTVNETLVAPPPPPPDPAVVAARLEAARQDRLELDRQTRLQRQQQTLLGVGIAFGAAAVLAQGVALGSHFQANQEGYASDDFRLLRTIQRSTQFAAVGFGAVAVGSFIAYGVLEHRREALPRAATRPRAGLTTPRFGVVLLPGGAGLSYGARF